MPKTRKVTSMLKKRTIKRVNRGDLSHRSMVTTIDAMKKMRTKANKHLKQEQTTINNKVKWFHLL